MTNDMVTTELISSKIYFIRGVKVMLDRDLAELYENLISQFVTSSWGGVRKMPYAFTEL